MSSKILAKNYKKVVNKLKNSKKNSEKGQAERWNKVYVGLTSDQQVKAEFFLRAIEERYKNDPAMLHLKLDEAKNKIEKHPTLLDKVELPTIKQRQDIEVKQMGSVSQRTR
jgi:phosphopantetheine adenylyltransferase